MATSRDKNQLKLLLGKGNGLLRPKRNMFFERLTNSWAFFLIDFRTDCVRFSVEDGQICIDFLRSWQFCTHHLLVHFIFSGYAFRFFSLFLLLVKFCYHNIQKANLKPTKNMKNPYIELLVDITAHNSLIFHSLFLLFCSSMRMNAVAASNWLPQFCKKDTT